MAFENRLNEVATAHARTLAARYGRHLRDGPDGVEALEPADTSPALPTAIHVVYEASDGDSARVVTLLSAWRTGEIVYFKGRCHLRRAIRTFRADRVSELICLATGEVPEDPAVWIADHALFDGERTPDYTPHALRLCRDELALLAFVGAVDGFFDEDEVEVAVDYVMMSTDRDIDRAKAAMYIRRLAPSVADLGDHLSALSRHPERWPTLTRAMRRLVDSDRKLAAEEQVAWTEISARFQEEVDARNVEAEAKAEAEMNELIAGSSIVARLELAMPEVRNMVATALAGRADRAR